MALLLACLSSVARGEGSGDERAQAVRLTSEGAAAYKAESYAKAIEKFDAAYRLYPAAPLLLNISRAHLKLSRCPEAIHYAELFKAAALSELKVASEDSPDAWLNTVQRSCIEAEVDSTPAGATIWIDGERQTSPDRTPWTGRLPIGKHKILLWRPGYQKQGSFLAVTADTPARLSLHLYPETTNEEQAALIASTGQGETSSAPPRPVQLLPLPASQPPESVAAARSTRNPVLRDVGYAGIAIGGAALVTAVVLAITVRSDTSALGVISGPRSTAQANASVSSIDGRATGANVLFAVGGVLAAVGIPLAVVF